MSVIFEAKVTQIGEMVSHFLRENMLVLYDETVPEELHDVAVLHTDRKNAGDIEVGDVLIIDNHRFTISFVGNRANQTLQDMGHATIKFNQGNDDLPGTICVENQTIPDISPHTKIQVLRNDES